MFAKRMRENDSLFEIIDVTKDEMEVIQLALLDYREQHIKDIERFKVEDEICVIAFNVIDNALETKPKEKDDKSTKG